VKLRDVLLDRLDSILQDFRSGVRGVRGIVLADANGLPIAYDTNGDLDMSVIAAMGTMIAQSADVVFENLHMSRPEITIIDGKEANLAVMTLPDRVASLLVVLEKVANLGLAKMEMRTAANRLGTAFGVNAKDTPRITELFILYNNGELIQHYSDALRTDHDRDILAGMLTAVQAFIGDTMSAKDGTLDKLSYGTHAVCFVRGTHTIGAFVVDGDGDAARYVVYDALKDFEEKYAKVLGNWNGTMEHFKGIDECFGKVLRP